MSQEHLTPDPKTLDFLCLNNVSTQNIVTKDTQDNSKSIEELNITNDNEPFVQGTPAQRTLLLQLSVQQGVTWPYLDDSAQRPTKNIQNLWPANSQSQKPKPG